MKKKILVISQYYYPEPFRVTDICEDLVKRGYEVTVLTGIPNYPEGRYYKGYGLRKKREEIKNGVKIIRIPIIPRGKNPIQLLMNYYSYVVSGKRWVRHTKLSFDSVFIFQLSPVFQAEVGTLYGKKRNVPVTIYVQDLWPESVEVVAGMKNKAIIGYINRRVDRIYKSCTNILATSPSFKEKLDERKSTKDETGKSKVVYWPQYPESFYIPYKPIDIPEDFPKDKKFKLTFTGNIGYAQGLDILPKLFKELSVRGKECDFVIIGDGRYKEAFKKEIQEAGAEDSFYLLGRKPATDIPAYLGVSDAAFISFSDNSLFNRTIPAKLQTYLACGKPILAAVKGETGNIIAQAECGLCSNAGDVKGLADNFCKLLESDLAMMGVNATRYAKDHFNKNELMDRLETII